MTDTNDIRDEFSPLLDDELSPDARDAVEAKLAQDAGLLRELDALRKVDELYRGLPRESAPNDMVARVRDQLQPKTNVAPLRARKVPRTLYTSLAAAAMFGVLIGGLVIRQEFVVSPSAEERIVASAPAADKANIEESLEQGTGGAFADGAVAEDFLEADDVAAQPGRQATREMLSEETAQADSRFRQEPVTDVPAAQPRESALAIGLVEEQIKDEAKARPQALAAAAPPPPAPSALDRARPLENEVEKAVEEAAPMVLAADADATDVTSAERARPSLAKKRANAVKRILDREFDQREDGWYQRSYNGEPTRVLRRGSEGFSALASSIPGLNDILPLEGDVVFRHDGTWYRVPPMVTD